MNEIGFIFSLSLSFNLPGIKEFNPNILTLKHDFQLIIT